MSRERVTACTALWSATALLAVSPIELNPTPAHLHCRPAGLQAACDYGAAVRSTVQSPSNDTTTGRQLTAVLNYVRGGLLPFGCSGVAKTVALLLALCVFKWLYATAAAWRLLRSKLRHNTSQRCRRAAPDPGGPPFVPPLPQLFVDDSIWDLLPSVDNEVCRLCTLL